jgi:hypothetical protein
MCDGEPQCDPGQQSEQALLDQAVDRVVVCSRKPAGKSDFFGYSSCNVSEAVGSIPNQPANKRRVVVCIRDVRSTQRYIGCEAPVLEAQPNRARLGDFSELVPD